MQQIISAILLQRTCQGTTTRGPTLRHVFIRRQSRTGIRVALGTGGCLLTTRPGNGLCNTLCSILTASSPGRHGDVRCVNDYVNQTTCLLSGTRDFSQSGSGNHCGIFLLGNVGSEGTTQRGTQQRTLTTIGSLIHTCKVLSIGLGHALLSGVVVLNLHRTVRPLSTRDRPMR